MGPTSKPLVSFIWAITFW